jgi:cystathionine beta-synthase
MRIVDSILEAVGNTPLVRLNSVTSHLETKIYGKLEYLNPGGSVKDRVAFQIIEDAENAGLLKPGGTIVEATSGNTGMGLALAAAIKGYKTVFVMPDKMSDEKIKSLRAFGARVVVTPTAVEPEDPRSYYSVSRRIAEETPGAFYANQYHNPSNPRAHYLSTGPELWEQLGTDLDAVVISMGTGGTISGTGKFLKEKNPNIQMIGVDPVGSILYDYFRTGQITEAHTYKVEGFGEDFIPTTTDFSFIDDIVRVTDSECFSMARRLVREEGLYTGGSAGGSVAGAIKWAEQNTHVKNIAVILPDSASRYLSKIFDDDWMQENGFLEMTPYEGHVADLLRQKTDLELISASPSIPVSEAVQLMKTHSISQLPVIDAQSKLLGIISEGDILNRLLNSSATPSTPVIDVCTQEYATVEPSTRLSVLGKLFGQKPITIVLDEKGAINGILTKIDLIEHVNRVLR